MSRLISPGYSPPRIDQAEQHLLFASLPSLLSSFDQVAASPSSYFCTPSCCWASLAYIKGGPLCLGWLLELHLSRKLTGTCPACLAELFITQLGGSILSGTNFCKGVCLQCNHPSTVRNSEGFTDKVIALLELKRQKPVPTAPAFTLAEVIRSLGLD